MTIPLGQRQLPRQWPTGKGNRAKTPQGRAQDRAQAVTNPAPTERSIARSRSMAPATSRGSGRRHGRPNGRQGAHTRGRRPPHNALIGREGAQHEHPGQNTPGGDAQRLSTTPPSMRRNLWRPCGGALQGRARLMCGNAERRCEGNGRRDGRPHSRSSHAEGEGEPPHRLYRSRGRST